MGPGVSLEAVERRLSEIWAEVLGLEQVDVGDDFFRLGGNSLAAVQIAARASEAFGAEVPLDAVFEARTVAAFARVVEASAGAVAAARAPAAMRMHDELSEREAAIWAWPYYGGPNLLGCGAYRLEGPLDVSTLERAFTELNRRHEILRTTYPADRGRPRIQILEPYAVRVELVDVCAEPPDVRELRLRAEIDRMRSEPLDYQVAPPVRVAVVRFDARVHVLLIAMHEIVCDGQGLVPLMRDLSLLYDALAAGGPSPFAEPALQYRDAISLQRGDVDAGRAYWERVRAELPIAVALPVQPGGPGPASGEEIVADVELAPAPIARLKAIAQDAAATPFMAYLSVFYVLLQRYSGERRLVVRSPAANRTTAQMEQVIGMFARVVPIQVDVLAGMSFRDLLGATRDAALPAFRHCNQMPLHEPALAIRSARGVHERLPIFRLHERPEPAPTFAGVRAVPIDEGWPATALTMDLTEHGPDAPATVVLSSHVSEIDRQGLEEMLVRYRQLIERLVEDPDRPLDEIGLLGDLPQVERAAASRPGDDRRVCLHALVEQRARARPDAPALRSATGALTYAALDARADTLAARLRARGLAPEACVGIALEPSVELVVALLAVLKAGGTCVPLEPGGASEQLPRLDLLLVNGAGQGSLPAAAAVLDLGLPEPPPAGVPRERGDAATAVEPERVAFFVQSAGVTGPPRAIPLTHAQLAELVDWQRATYELTAADVALHAPGPGVLTWALTPWPYLASGGAVVVPRRGAAALDEQPDVTIAALAPAAASRHVAAARADGATLRLLLVQGYGALAVPATGAPGDLRILRQYAVAEAGGTVLVEAVTESTEAWGGVTAAGPDAVRGEVRVVDVHGHALPDGTIGELHVDGRPTGDRGCRFAAGGVRFVGRKRDVVQLRGFHLEPALGEIEAALVRHSRIQAAIAFWDEARSSLVAAIVPKAEPPAVRDLDRWLRAQVRSHVLPARYVAIDAVPLRPDGSPDRAALTTRASGVAQVEIEPDVPRGRTAKQLLRVWAKLLGRDLGVHDNFFVLGGTFALGVELAARAQRVGIPLTPPLLLMAPTVGGLLDLIEEQ